jgi:hypothetical protein
VTGKQIDKIAILSSHSKPVDIEGDRLDSSKKSRISLWLNLVFLDILEFIFNWLI